tara:strand:- start:1105 stop:1332 length:228 start_codon:yes stop_codon:yes gene_type:complete
MPKLNSVYKTNKKGIDYGYYHPRNLGDISGPSWTIYIFNTKRHRAAQVSWKNMDYMSSYGECDRNLYSRDNAWRI